MGKLLKRMKDERGSALVTVFLTIVVLLVLGAGLMALSVGAAKQSVAVDSFEKVYYPAEGACAQGVEYIKKEALKAYSEIEADLMNYTMSSNNAVSFFAKINAAGFTPTQPDKSTGAAVTDLNASISVSSAGNTRTYTITSTASGSSSMARTLTASVQVTFAPISFTPGKTTLAYGDEALIIDADLNMDAKNSSITIKNSTAHISGKLIDSKRGLQTDLPVRMGPLEVPLNWSLNYSDFPQSKTTVTPNVTTNNKKVNANGTNPLTLEGGTDINFTVDKPNATSGQIAANSSGNLTIQSGTLSNVSIYTGSGDLTLTNMTLKKCKIYCGGNLNSDSTTFADCQVFVNGNATLTGDSRDANGSKLFLFCGGIFDFDLGIIENVIIYARSGLKLDHGHGNANKTQILTGLLYTLGKTVVNDYTLQGQLITKGGYSYEDVNSRCSNEIDITTRRDISELIADAGFDPFETSGISETKMPPIVILPTNNLIFVESKPVEN